MILSRRSFLIGLTSALAAPAIVRAASIMPIRALSLDFLGAGTVPLTSDLYAELAEITRRAFVPRLYTQIYVQPPTLSFMRQLEATNA